MTFKIYIAWRMTAAIYKNEVGSINENYTPITLIWQSLLARKIGRQCTFNWINIKLPSAVMNFTYCIMDIYLRMVAHFWQNSTLGCNQSSWYVNVANLQEKVWSCLVLQSTIPIVTKDWLKKTECLFFFLLLLKWFMDIWKSW